MKIDFKIDEKLLKEAIRVSGKKTEKEVIEKGLKLIIQIKKQEATRKLKWSGDLGKMRLD